MSAETTLRVKTSIATWLSILGAIAAVVGSYTLAQSQIADHDKRIIRLDMCVEQARKDMAIMRELLIRIDERTAEIKRKQDMLK